MNERVRGFAVFFFIGEEGEKSVKDSTNHV